MVVRRSAALLAIGIVCCAFLVAPVSAMPPSPTPSPSQTVEATEEPTSTPAEVAAVAKTVGPEWAAFSAIAEHIDDFTIVVHSHEMLGNIDRVGDIRFAFRKPNLARCDYEFGPAFSGGTVLWRGGPKGEVHIRPSGPFLMVLPRNNKRVTDLLGYACGDSSPYQIVGYLSHNGTLSESPGPTIAGDDTALVTWRARAADGAPVDREELYISKTTHAIVATKGYRGTTLVEDSSWVITVDPGVPYSRFDIGG